MRFNNRHQYFIIFSLMCNVIDLIVECVYYLPAGKHLLPGGGPVFGGESSSDIFYGFQFIL